MAAPDQADCPHPVQVAGLCAVCGKELDSAALSGTSIVMSHSSAGIKVSASEAQRLDSESTGQLLSQRRLALIIDLDQTIIHATVDPTVEEWMKDPSNPNYGALATVGRFKLGMDGKSVVKIETHEDMRKRAESAQKEGRETPSDAWDDDDTPDGCWYYVKPRPGLEAFLRALTLKYELHVYTMGTRSYANCVCKLVDADGTLFGSRILSRDENGSLMQKSLARLFPVDTSMVVIIDDRSDVWNRSPNLLKVIPYDFFVGIGDINATFLPPPPSLSTPTDEMGDISADVAPDMSGDSSVSPAGSAPSDAASSTTPATSPAGSVGSPGAATAVTADAEDKAAEVAKTAAEKAAEEKAEQTQRAVISEQVDSRPLAKMQEALDERLSHAPGSVPSAASDVAKGLSDAPSTDTNGKEEGTVHAEESNQFHAMHAVLKDDDEELSRLEDILDTIHEQWYENWDAMYDAKRSSMEKAQLNDEQSRRRLLASLPKPSVITIIANIKRAVLEGCKIVFTGVIPLGERQQEADIWKIAEEFGAKCLTSVSSAVTHLIAAKPGTEKVRQAYKLGHVHVVYPGWLYNSVATWNREQEEHYALPREERHGSKPAEPSPAFPELQLFDDNNSEPDSDHQQEQVEELEENLEMEEDVAMSAMDWGEAADEVDAYLDDEDDEDETTDGRSQTSNSGTRTPESLAKRPRDSGEGPTESTTDEADHSGSPLSKRRKLAEARSGKSNLKHSIGDEEREEQTNIPSRPPSRAGTDAGSVDLDAFADDLELELDGS